MTVIDVFREAAAHAGFCGQDIANEKMSAHTTFMTGGPADLWVRPEGAQAADFCACLLKKARDAAMPVFIMGGGANLLVADKGVRGIVLDTGGMKDIVTGKVIRAQAGVNADALCQAAAAAGLSGAEFLAGLPGTIGGAVFMNARCWDREVADILLETEVIDKSGERRTMPALKNDFSYKKSPFQGKETLILGAAFALQAEEPAKAALIYERMNAFKKQREEKGHYRYPCAGSVFKNNRAFGMPSGQIIDSLGLRGARIGGAQIAPWHGNLIVNTGGASSEDVRALITLAQDAARARLGIDLEPELVFVGDF
jgi:UDP-N-acetylmuramate dehydrogenase